MVDEIESLLRDQGVQGIKIFDSTFTLQRRHVHEFLDEVERRGLRPVDNVPLLLQPGLSVSELRRVRLEFVTMRVSSARFVTEKPRAIFRQRSLGAYFGILKHGLRRRSAECAGRT